MPSTFGDASTVVGDPTYRNNGDEFTKSASLKAQPIRRANIHGKSPEAVSEFNATMDYEERPFFVPIGKDGVISALEKLDKQLLQVHSCSTSQLTAYSLYFV